MFEDRSIAWMMSGGNRFESAHDRLDHVHARAMHEGRVATAPRLAVAFRSRLSRARAAIGIAAASVTTTSTTPDCCAA